MADMLAAGKMWLQIWLGMIKRSTASTVASLALSAMTATPVTLKGERAVKVGKEALAPPVSGVQVLNLVKDSQNSPKETES